LRSATALLKQNPKPNDTDIDDAMRGRCSTYSRIRAAIHTAAHVMEGQVMIF
jgi:isoquinoline 1-oxidoreductase subunit alpha